jgi:uncharacterized protein
VPRDAHRGRIDGARGAGAAPAAGGTRAGGGRRRRSTAGAALAAMLLGFFVAGLLDAAALRRDAETMPIGGRRTVALWFVRPVAALGGAIGFDEPARALDRVLGRDGEGAHHTRDDLVAGGAAAIWPRTVTPARPLRLYVGGDSMAGQFGGHLVALAGRTGLVRARLDYRVSSGLSRPDFFDWPQRLIDEVADTRAEAVVMLLGGNDAQDVEWDGRVLDVGTPAWLDVYRLRVAEAMDIASAGGRRVYWVGQPVMRDRAYDERMAMLDRVYEEEAARHDGVTYIDARSLFAGPDGGFAAYLRGPDGVLTRMRGPDGVHFTRAGADRLAVRVLEVVRRDWGIQGDAR